MSPRAPSAPLRVLAVSGSLRAKSINTAVLFAVRSLASTEMEVSLFLGLGDLPHFNPDLDTATPPPSSRGARPSTPPTPCSSARPSMRMASPAP